MILIAGLGNPTLKYKKTRHNMGFDVIDAIARKYNIKVRERRGKALCGTGYMEGVKVLLAKPQTFMNLSGDSVAALINYYNLTPEKDLIVICDDIHLEPGNLRVRRKGSAGGHNGMKDIIKKCGTQDFARIRVGVGAKPDHKELVDHVLGRFSKKERERVDAAISDAAEAASLIARGNTEEAMNRYNGKKNTFEQKQE